MRIGRLDQRIGLQRKIVTPDDMGGSVTTYEDDAETPLIWAAITPVRGSEVFDESRTNAISLSIFTVRFRDDINETDRLVWRDITYNIRSVRNVSQRNLYLSIEAERGVST